MELTIQNWAEEMVRIYTWLTIKFEYSNRYKTFLVDLVYPSQYGDDENFHRAAMAFNDKMCDTYGDDAPLFTNNGKLFSLSDDAQIVCEPYSDFKTMTLDIRLLSLGDWNQSLTPVTTSHIVQDVEARVDDNVNFDIAA
ncbi:MAG: hypothetical protein IJ724_07215 [Muribaculaceae bacterium]|nr:hypothetical protein [Muribaculaceae bacterium]MBR1726420.1 hypothetical protein [Muribaculaceae bacterium]